MGLSKGASGKQCLPMTILRYGQVAQGNDLGNDICSFPKVMAPPDI